MMADQAHEAALMRGDQSESERPDGSLGKRSILFMMGGEWGRSTDLRWNAPKQFACGSAFGNGLGIGVRLGQVLQNRWRLNFCIVHDRVEI